MTAKRRSCGRGTASANEEWDSERAGNAYVPECIRNERGVRACTRAFTGVHAHAVQRASQGRGGEATCSRQDERRAARHGKIAVHNEPPKHRQQLPLEIFRQILEGRIVVHVVARSRPAHVRAAHAQTRAQEGARARPRASGTARGPAQRARGLTIPQ